MGDPVLVAPVADLRHTVPAPGIRQTRTELDRRLRGARPAMAFENAGRSRGDGLTHRRIPDPLPPLRGAAGQPARGFEPYRDRSGCRCHQHRRHGSDRRFSGCKRFRPGRVGGRDGYGDAQREPGQRLEQQRRRVTGFVRVPLPAADHPRHQPRSSRPPLWSPAGAAHGAVHRRQHRRCRVSSDVRHAVDLPSLLRHSRDATG